MLCLNADDRQSGLGQAARTGCSGPRPPAWKGVGDIAFTMNMSGAGDADLRRRLPTRTAAGLGHAEKRNGKDLKARGSTEGKEGSSKQLSARLDAWFTGHFKTHDARLHHRLGSHDHQAGGLIDPVDGSGWRVSAVKGQRRRRGRPARLQGALATRRRATGGARPSCGPNNWLSVRTR